MNDGVPEGGPEIWGALTVFSLFNTWRFIARNGAAGAVLRRDSRVIRGLEIRRSESPVGDNFRVARRSPANVGGYSNMGFSEPNRINAPIHAGASN